MKKCFLLSTFLFLLGIANTHAQFSRYIIRFKNKNGTPYTTGNPASFLTQRAIDRRTKYNIAIDETDLPIPPRYLDSIRLAGNVSILNVSKWLNQVCILTTDAVALNKINGFAFVQSASGIAARPAAVTQPVNKQLDAPSFFTPASTNAVQNTSDVYSYGAAFDQVHLHNAEFLHNYNFRGQGMQLAVIDAGFANYLTLPTFDSARVNNQILGTWDFVTNDNSVNEDDSHGMKCLSTIAANMPGSFVGSAPAASFYLYRTEDVASEYPVEEQNWAAAAERADSLGVDIITTSLGYTSFDNSSLSHTYADMNGNSTIMARAANAAAKKGILVLAAAGNDGNAPWHYIATAGDADSALTIGAVNSSRQVASFSSYGPNSDGQIKPDIAAIGSNATVAATSTGQPVSGNGTSFATPIMAGITTCLWQAFPEIKNMDIIQGLRQSADRFSNPDDRSGYGIPDVKKAFVNFTRQLHTSSAIINSCHAFFSYTVKAAAGMNVVIERMLPSDPAYLVVSNTAFTGGFYTRSVNYNDDLSGYNSGVNIRYRIKMNIGNDTSFYLDSFNMPYNSQCTAVTERKICAGAATYFSVDSLAGYTCHWQVDTGSGFVDITNSSIYNGVSTRLLILRNLPPNFYGYQYRCVQTNGSNSIISTAARLKFSSEWTGTVSTAWEDAANWSCGAVPSQYTDVTIPGEVPNFPVINTNATCHSLLTLPGVSVIVKTGLRLDISGH